MSPTEYQELVVFIGRRFDTIAERFDGVDRRFGALQGHIDERFREVHDHFDEIYRRLERLDQEHVATTQALRRLER